MHRVLFLTQTQKSGAAARYRVYQYLDYLKQHDVECEISPAVYDDLIKKACSSKSPLIKCRFYLSQFFNRISYILKVRNYDVIFFQRDVIVHLYPFIEKLMHLFNKKVIFDFDDAIYLFPSNKKPSRFFTLFWDRRKIERIIKMSKHVIVGNNFLKNYAQRYSRDVTVIPTSIEVSNFNKKIINTSNVTGVTTIGWIGSQGTFHYLESVFPILEILAKKYIIQLNVIGAKGSQIKGVRVNYRDWNLDTELKEIYNFDIGIMPLTDDEWSRGKSATKLLQYMAAGIPAVASPVGVNSEIIKDGINGFLAENKEAWIEKISMLIDNKELCLKITENARKDVERFYSVQANAPKLLDVIRKISLGS